MMVTAVPFQARATSPANASQDAWAAAKKVHQRSLMFAAARFALVAIGLAQLPRVAEN
jgi:hypothetical protein